MISLKTMTLSVESARSEEAKRNDRITAAVVVERRFRLIREGSPVLTRLETAVGRSFSGVFLQRRAAAEKHHSLPWSRPGPLIRRAHVPTSAPPARRCLCPRRNPRPRLYCLRCTGLRCYSPEQRARR